MVLEILNSCLTNQLVHCPNLVYTLLYKRSVFEQFRSNPAFQDIIQNIDMVCLTLDYVHFYPDSSTTYRYSNLKGRRVLFNPTSTSPRAAW